MVRRVEGLYMVSDDLDCKSNVDRLEQSAYLFRTSGISYKGGKRNWLAMGQIDKKELLKNRNIKLARIRWAGHVEENWPTKLLNQAIRATRAAGRRNVSRLKLSRNYAIHYTYPGPGTWPPEFTGSNSKFWRVYTAL